MGLTKSAVAVPAASATASAHTRHREPAIHQLNCVVADRTEPKSLSGRAVLKGVVKEKAGTKQRQGEQKGDNTPVADTEGNVPTSRAKMQRLRVSAGTLDLA